MGRIAAFLRGMNLGGRRITNPALCAEVEALGFTSPQAFLASGNLVFDGKGSPSTIQRRLEQGLTERLGYEVPCFVRTGNEVCHIAAMDPFGGRAAGARGKVQVALLAAAPGAKALREVSSLASDDDWLAFDGRELYWWPAGNMSASELDLDRIGRLLGTMTIRTQRTLVRMATKFFG